MEVNIMDRKGKRLTEKAMGTDNSRLWDKVADYVGDWTEVREFIIDYHYRKTDNLQEFESACTRYNDAVNNPELSTGQKAGLLTGAAIIGLALGLKSK